MKKIITVIIPAILTVGILCGFNHFEHNYTRENCEVVEVNDEVVTVKDYGGLLWEFKGNGFKVGDIVDIEMFDSNTSAYVYDDVIKNVVKREM